MSDLEPKSLFGWPGRRFYASISVLELCTELLCCGQLYLYNSYLHQSVVNITPTYFIPVISFYRYIILALPFPPEEDFELRGGYSPGKLMGITWYAELHSARFGCSR